MKSSLEFLKTKSKQSGLEFLIHFGVRKFFDDSTSVRLTTSNQWKIAPQHKDYVQPYLHVFDIPLLKQLLPKHGFRIDKIDYFTYVGDTTGGNKGHVGLIATKV